MAARRSGHDEAQVSAPKGIEDERCRSARANKLAAFGFTGFLVLMAGAAAIALDFPAKAALLRRRGGRQCRFPRRRLSDRRPQADGPQAGRRCRDRRAPPRGRECGRRPSRPAPGRRTRDPRAAASLRMGEGRARVAAPSRHSGDRHRRAHAVGPLAGPPAPRADRCRRRRSRPRPESTRCPTCRW